MRVRRTSRILNEDAVLMALNLNDFIALAILLCVLQMVFRPSGYAMLALAIAAGCAVVLSGIRFRCRRRIIRDSFVFYFGVRHDDDVRKEKRD